MRYPASEKLEIIRTVEQSHLSAKRTLDQLGLPRRTFYRWYDRYLEGGPEALEDRPSAPSRVWNRIPAGIHDQIIELALEQSELSPRELAVRFTDECVCRRDARCRLFEPGLLGWIAPGGQQLPSFVALGSGSGKANIGPSAKGQGLLLSKKAVVHPPTSSPRRGHKKI